MIWKNASPSTPTAGNVYTSNRRMHLKVLLALCIVLFLRLEGMAIQMVPFEIEELSAKSQIVLQGTVLSKSVQRDPEGRIYTRIKLDVAEVWKGNVSSSRYSIVQGGGVLGDEQSIVSGEADYEIGEEIVAFLVVNQRGEGVSLGLAQGKFHVWMDTGTGEKLARNIFHGNPEDKPESGAGEKKQLKQPGKKLTITELKQRTQGAK